MENKISWVEKKLWLSSLLYCCIYWAVGWNTAERTEILTSALAETLDYFSLELNYGGSILLVKILTLGVIITVSLIFVHPLSIVTFIFEESINSDVKGFIVILFWSLSLVFMLYYFDYFADILVVTSSTILFRFDLKKKKVNVWQIVSITITLAIVFYTAGMLSHGLIIGG
ncbi:MAG: hypothetical protein IGQ45_12760 [Cyanobacterium sp. T60_A2020_053]|nr:hypothetical protein [Cyanobacterium sp. T60_A2020_053]